MSDTKLKKQKLCPGSMNLNCVNHIFASLCFVAQKNKEMCDIALTTKKMEIFRKHTHLYFLLC